MRLVDADALKEEIEFHPTSVSVCMTVAEAKGQTYFKNRCLEDIDNAPTIDAIPMWWITEKYLDVLNKDKELSKAVWLVRKAWQKEQDAQDE
jgi:hypothetical protein